MKDKVRIATLLSLSFLFCALLSAVVPPVALSAFEADVPSFTPGVAFALLGVCAVAHVLLAVRLVRRQGD